LKEQFYQELLLSAPDAETAKFLLTVSGGRDSVVLAHLFVSFQLNFDIAHCNFHLRGEESNKEMTFVQKLPFLTNQKVFVKEFDTLQIQQNSNKSIEMMARELRYKWFEEIGKEYDYIVTAHHANDNAETIILNLLRGTGLRGMCGIPQKNGKIIRPLLRFSSSAIEKYSIEHKIKYCVDSSNLSNDFFRNKIRNKVIPELEKINPNCIEIFTKNSQIFLQQTKFFDAQIQQYKNISWNENEDRVCISIEKLKKIEYPELILYELINKMGFSIFDVQKILKSLDSNSGKRFVSDTHLLIKDRNCLIIEKKKENRIEEIIIHDMDELAQYGFRIEKHLYNPNFEPVKTKDVIYVDAQKLSFPLTIRSWKNGDFFYPFGMKTKKKVSDFFTDIKIDILEKQKVKILSSQNQIVWIVNYRADNRFRVDECTEFYYQISD